MSEDQFKTAQPNPTHPDIFDVDPNEVLESKSQIKLIDVREPDEYVGELGHVQSAQSIPLGELETRWNEVPQDGTVVFICRSGGRSGKATAFAHAQGHGSAYNLKGGMLLWNELGFETTTEEQ